MVLHYPHIRRLFIFLAAIALILALTPRVHAAQHWTAYTTLMERYHEGAGHNRTSAEYDRHMNDLVSIAQSQSVMQRAAETLYRLQITEHPEAILSTLQIRRVPNSNTLVIEVTDEDKDEAKAAADVVAAEFRGFCDDLQQSQSRDRGTATGMTNVAERPSIMIVDPARVRPAPWAWPLGGDAMVCSSVGIVIFALGLAVGLFAGTRFARRRASRA